MQDIVTWGQKRRGALYEHVERAVQNRIARIGHDDVIKPQDQKGVLDSNIKEMND